MTTPPDFIAELYRAGNAAMELTPFEARRLLERALVKIGEMRIAEPKTPTPENIDERLAIIGDFARNIAGLPPQLLAHGLFDAADLIREMQVDQA